jgi:hypothetical protein
MATICAINDSDHTVPIAHQAYGYWKLLPIAMKKYGNGRTVF